MLLFDAQKRYRFGCPVCRIEKDFSFVEQCGEYRLYRCLACDLVFSDPMKSEGPKWYDKAYFVRHIAVDDRIMWYFSWTIKHVPHRGKLLDVGCAEGTFVSYVAKKGFDAHGIDFSAESIEAGKRRFGLTTLSATTLEEFSFTNPPEIFDVITFFDVLEHVESPLAFLAGIKSLLKRGGFISLSVPNRDRWPIREFVDYPPNHLTRWNERALRKLLETSGFHILKMEQSPVSLSVNYFFGHFLRILLYKMLNSYGKVSPERTEGI